MGRRADGRAAREPMTTVRRRRLRIASAAAISAVLLATTFGATDVLGQQRKNRQRVRPAATTVSIESSLALVTAVGFDGAGTQHESHKEDADFEIFDDTAKFNDTDDRPRGAAAKTTQLTTIADDGTTVALASRSDGNARYYDRDTGDEAQPAAGGESLVRLRFDVAGGTAFFSIRGSIHGEGTAGGSTGCGAVRVETPNGTRQTGCIGSFTVPIDLSGPLDPGSHLLEIDGGIETELGHASARGAFDWDLRFVVSACTVLGTPGDDPNLDGTPDDDVICGLGGEDTIDAGDGDDTVFGGSGKDIIDAGRGSDTVFGGEGSDQITGRSGRDALFGGLDGDVLTDDIGPNPMLDGGDGVDLICGSAQRDVIRGGANSDILRGRGGSDDVHGDAGDDDIFGEGSGSCGPGALGARQRDDLDGGPGDDTIHGGPDRDTIVGGTGKDRMFGEAANDALNACDKARDTTVSGGPGGNDVVRRDGVDPSSGNEVRRPC
jgi:Ca2+-binding RTX toxin-like protein